MQWKSIQTLVAEDRTGLDLVFPKPNGKLLDYDAFLKSLNCFLDSLGAEHTKYHSRVFRHTYASYLVKQGIKPKHCKNYWAMQILRQRLNTMWIQT
jgi:hypothetical protein